MQVTQADASKCKRAGEEDFTNQPTSHTNKMKKYIRSKNAVAPDSPPPILGIEERVKLLVQPPLPLDPPPPDKPPNMSITLKEEVEDIDYNNPSEESSEEASSAKATDDFKANELDNTNNSKTMCRDFIRGKCTRLGTCRFSHKCDVSQLAGVYTFCNDFQNSVCTRPSCKYVHATVFEEQRFYRTGELPSHAFSHYKKVNLLPPPPPPPEDPPTDLQHLFKVPPPPLPKRPIKPPVLNNMPPGKLDSRVFPDTMGRDWSNLIGGTSSDMQHESELQKRCKKCEVFDLRMEFMVDKLEKIRKARLERSQAMKVLSLKRERLQTTLLTLLRPSYQGSLGSSSMTASQSNSPDRQKWLLDQLNSTLSSNLITGMPEDTNRTSFNSNQNGSSLLSKLLSAYARQNMNSDASRNT